MTRIVVQALVAGAVAAVLLLQLKETQELFAWEILLGLILIWMVSRIPGRVEHFAIPLFDFDRQRGYRAPRSLASVEFVVIDALQGYLSPERRLRPTLRRIASHRLQRRGLAIDTSPAAEALGEDNWRWLMSEDDETPDPGRVDEVLTRLEAL